MKKKTIALLLAGILAASALAGCGAKKTEAGGEAAQSKEITVAASPTPHAEILKEAGKIMAEQGYTLTVKEFTDYVQPNMALENGEVQANYFQHKPYLDDFNVKNKTHLVSVAAIHYEPLGLYPGKTKSLDALADGATIAVPNDTTNEARALLLLETQGLIKIKSGAGLAATANDIVENKKNLKIKELEAATLSRSLPEVDLAVINGNYAVDAGLAVDKDALAKEEKNSDAAAQFANIIAVKEGSENNAAVKALVEALKSDTVKKFIEDNYKGAVLPVD